MHHIVDESAVSEIVLWHDISARPDLRRPEQSTAAAGWVTSGRAETLETVAFRSGAALTVLDQLVGDPRHGVPAKLLANRLALSAARADVETGRTAGAGGGYP